MEVSVFFSTFSFLISTSALASTPTPPAERLTSRLALISLSFSLSLILIETRALNSPPSRKPEMKVSPALTVSDYCIYWTRNDSRLTKDIGEVGWLEVWQWLEQ